MTDNMGEGMKLLVRSGVHEMQDFVYLNNNAGFEKYHFWDN